MGLLKGSPSVSRYRLLDPIPDEFTHDFVAGRLRKYAFADIESLPDESACGWTELFDEFAAGFDTEAFRFGTNYAFGMRLDSRKLPMKILNRYYKIREIQFEERNGRKPNTRKRRELKEELRLELLKRTLLQTDVYDVVWFTKSSEVWLFATGEKLRGIFEELFGQTFGLSMRLIVPVTLGLEFSDSDKRAGLMALRPGFFSGEEPA